MRVSLSKKISIMVGIINWFHSFLFLGTVFIVACKPSVTTPSDTIAIGLRQSGRLATEVVVRVDSIQDSRCPTGATCIWAGQARVTLLLSKNTDSTTVRLVLGPNVNQDNATRLDSASILLNSERFSVVLRDVTPYPSVPPQNQTQTAVVQIIRL
ncbi:MAG: hypothetical protein JWP57_2083 [Spirosoma sp.]|nr:hypothetical protein [Spirosoma sp.]